MDHIPPLHSAAEPGRSRWQNISATSLVGGVFCLQFGLLAMFVTNCVGTRCYLGLHLGVSAMIVIIGLWVCSKAKAGNRDTPLIVQLAIWTAFGGPFGTAIAAMLLVPQRVGPDDADPATTTASGGSAGTGLPRWELLHIAMLDGRLRLEGANLVRPLLDVMLDGTQSEKLEALSLISKRYEPTLVPALRQAIGDKDAAVRVLAATVMAQHARVRPIDARGTEYGRGHATS